MTQFLTFLGIISVLTITPGADTMLVIRNVVVDGKRAGYLTALGGRLGLFVHATLSALGLSIILVRSAAIFEIVKLTGACYLIVLGAWSLWQVIRDGKHTEEVPMFDRQRARTAGGWHPTWEGLLTNVLNPKTAIFYLAFLPQFINPGDSVLLKSLALAGVHFLVSLLWLLTISAFLGRLRGIITRAPVQRALEAVAGTILIVLGIRLATIRR